jgi:hypothetical protein
MATRSQAVARMRLHRQRSRMNLRCIVVELRETEIDESARRGLLTEDTRNDRLALRHAVHSHLDQTLTPQIDGARRSSVPRRDEQRQK